MVEDQSSNGEIMNTAVTALQKRLMVRGIQICSTHTTTHTHTHAHTHTHTHTQTHTQTHTHKHIHTLTILLTFIQHEKKVLDELQVEHQQKKQLLNKATELLACLDKGMEYNWTPDQVGYRSRQLQAAKRILHSHLIYYKY